MSFAAEMRDFVSAFNTMSSVLGTPESREAERLNNDARRAQIDYTRARTNEIMGPQIAFGGAAPGILGGQGAVDASVAGDTARVADTATPGAYVPSILSPTGDKAPPRPGTASAAIVPAPPPRPTAALDDSDLGGGTGPDTMAGAQGADTLRRTPPTRGYQVKIKDRTTWAGMQPRALKIMDTITGTANQMGITLKVTAGAGGGHRSHSAGTEIDLVGYHADGSIWTPRERAIIAMSGGSVGANRFGLYPGGSLHIGYAGTKRPSAVWGAGGIVSGPSARMFKNPADQEFLRRFQSGKLYGMKDHDYLGGGGASDFNSGGGGADRFGSLENIIRLEARRRNMNEDIAVRVARSEGLAPGVWQSNVVRRGKRETSYGPYQLLVGGGLGDEFAAKYGDPRDTRTVHRQIQFALDKAAENGWGAWYGAAKVGVGKRDGLENARAIGVDAGDYTGDLGVSSSGGMSAQYGGAPSAPAPITDPYAKDDELMAPIEEPVAEARTKDDALGPSEAPEARTKDDLIAGATAAPTPLVHEVAKGDTLWDLAERYNLDTYMRIVEANPDVIEDPDLIYPGERLKIPGGVGEEVDVPTPRERPATEARTKDEAIAAPDQRQRDDLEANVPLPRARPTASYTPYDNPPGEVRPAGGPGALPPDSYTPMADEPEAEMQRAMDRREQIVADDTQPPAIKEALLRALDVKIQQLSGRTGGTGSYTPTELVRPVQARPNSPRYRAHSTPLDEATSNEFIRDIRERRRATGPGPGAVGEGIAPADSAVASDELAGGSGADQLWGSDKGIDEDDDTMTPAETSIREVTDAWKISKSGHVMRPDGREYPDDTFTAGRKAAIHGRSWLANMIFGEGVEAVDLEEDTTPDDGSDTPDGADLYLSGGGVSLSADQVGAAEAEVDKWAAENGVTMTDSERTMRAGGLLYSFWLMRDPEKAAAIAAGWMGFKQIRYNQYSAIAKAALAHGDDSAAVKAAVKAYAEIPDGRDFSVEGDAASGYKVRYTDEETGKVITEKVLTPQEMIGMIMNMSPGDVDKFLVKAAGQDELPEASPELTKFLADLESLPPDQQPVLDAAAMAGLDGDEQQIALAKLQEKVRLWTDRTGGAAGAARRETIEQILGPADAAPAAPAPAPAPTAETAATPPAAGAPATAPTTATPVSTGAVDIEGGSDTLAGGTITPKVTGEVAPGVFPPGPNRDYGLGPPPSVNLREAVSAEDPQFGLELSNAKQTQELAEYNRKLELRQTEYANWRLTHPNGAVEETPPVPGAGPPATMEGGWLGDPSRLAKAQQFEPYLQPAIAPVLPPGPNDNNYGVGNEPFNDPLAAYNQTEQNVGLLGRTEAAAQREWRPRYEAAKKAYDDAVGALTPTPRKDDDSLKKITGEADEFVTTLKESGKLPEAEIKQIDNNRILIGDAARELAMINNLSNASAINKVINMIRARPENPALPAWRAFPAEFNSSIMLVQPMGPNGPSGQVLQVPRRLFDPLAQAWRENSEQLASQITGKPPEPGFFEGIVGAVTEAIPGSIGNVPEEKRPISELPGDLADWLQSISPDMPWENKERISPDLPWPGR